ncbi:MAG: DUF3299 domain-containing protein [Woeseiaceae bacterium]
MVALHLCLNPVNADTARDLKWSNLIPAQIDLPTPLDHLTKTQRKDIEYIAWIGEMLKAGMLKENTPAAQDAKKGSRQLAKDGLNVPQLIEHVSRSRERRLRHQKRVVKELDGTFVRIPGYAVPLELSGSKVTEFLLVPYVGACIHTPPPPPNQIVHVEADHAFHLQGLFAPVSVTGHMVIKEASKSLFLVDGASDIDIGYSLKDAHIETLSK